MLPETPIPSVPAVPDLSDAEFAELDDLLTQTPEPLDGLDAVMLDGFLCGVLVQPRVIPVDEWLPHVFDFEAQALPQDTDPAWRSRTVALIRRRHDALNRTLVEDGLFDPLVLELDDDDEVPSAEDEADAAGLDPVSQALMPWVAGFQYATICFPDLVESADDDVALALARLYRHLPAETDEERELVETMRREQPLATLDDALEDLIVTVADLAELTREQRFHVDTVRRDTPKVGRNDPCPCGSGRKFKQCHGAG